MKSSTLIAIGIAGVAALWMASAAVFPGEEQTGPAAPAAAAASEDLFAVRVVRLTAAPMTREVVVNGRTEAFRSVDLRAEIRGQVEEILDERGATLTTGQPIARIAVEARKAELEQARATLELRRIENEAAKTLSQRGFATDVRRAEAQAQLEAAQAQLRLAELAMEKTTVVAPIDGILDQRPVEVGDYVDVKDPVATIVDLDPIKIVVSVTERNVADLTLGAPAIARTLTGEEVTGTITFISSQADPAARTFQVEMQAPNPDKRIVAGLTASVRLPIVDKMAHKVSPAVLTLDDQGTIGVKVVDGGDVVRFMPVILMGSDEEGVWLSGLPDQVTLVTVGQEFIAPGQKVRPVEGGLS
jgi:multidrug efflux system membrane fusion protein